MRTQRDTNHMLKILASNTPPSWNPFHAQLARILIFHTSSTRLKQTQKAKARRLTAEPRPTYTPPKRNFRPTLGQTHCFYVPGWVTQKTPQEEKPHRFQQTPTAMDPEDVATNTLITILTVGKRAPPNTPP